MQNKNLLGTLIKEISQCVKQKKNNKIVEYFYKLKVNIHIFLYKDSI